MTYLSTKWQGIGLALLTLTALCLHPLAHAFPQNAAGGKSSGELVFKATLGAIQIEEKLALPMPSQAGILNQKIAVGNINTVLKDYIPNAEFTPVIKKVDKGAPVIELTLASKSEKLVQYLNSADPAKDELGTTIADFSLKSFASEADVKAGFQAYQMAQMQAPVLKLVAENGKTYSVIAIKGTKKEIDEPKATVEILDFMPHFQSNQGGGKPVNGSSKMVNPAVKYAITIDGKTLESWSFARFPGFSMNKNQNLPFKCTLKAVIEKENQVTNYVIAVCNGKMTLWTLKDKKASSSSLDLNKKTPIVSDITFEVTKLEPSGTLESKISKSKNPRTPPALRVEVELPDKTKTERWIAAGNTVKVAVGEKELLMTFGPKSMAKAGGMGGAHGMPGGMGGSGMPKNHPPMGGSGMGGSGMPKNHPPMGGSGMGGSKMPKNHPPMGGSGMGGGMPKNHPPVNPPKEVPKEEKK